MKGVSTCREQPSRGCQSMNGERKERVARHRILASKQSEKGESRPQRMSELQWDKGRGEGGCIRRIAQPKDGFQSWSETETRVGLARGAGHWCWAST